MSPHYPNEAIDFLTDLVKGNRDNARILAKAGFPELALVVDAIEGNESIIDLLKRKNQFIIAAFLTVILTDEKGVVPFLIKNKAAHWAATANAVCKDDQAMHWLEKNNLKPYAELAKAIKMKMEEEEGSGFEMLYKPPI